MDEVKAAAAAVEQARLALERAEQRRNTAIRAALADQVPVSEIAAATGLSRLRVYQVRDGRR